jgi:hypothetical protein
VLRADVSQFYPSIYTHVIAWAAHGKDQAKLDRSPESKTNIFNALDSFVQNAQGGQTRGVLIGPDAYRIIAEFISVKVDQEIVRRAGSLIVGAGRHVDDYYIGVRSELDAAAVLSHLRDALREYELHVNDLKTKIIASTAPLDDPWAADLRIRSEELLLHSNEEKITSFLEQATKTARDTESKSHQISCQAS